MKELNMPAYVDTSIVEENIYPKGMHQSKFIPYILPALDILCVLLHLIQKLDKSTPDFADKVCHVIRDFKRHIFTGGRPIDVFCDEPEGSPLHAAHVLGISPSTIVHVFGSLDVTGPAFLAWIAEEFS